MNCDDIVTMSGYYPSDMTAIIQFGGLKVDNLRYSTFKEKKVSQYEWDILVITKVQGDARDKCYN